ncbi:MAG: TolC family protein [Acidobacteria bacterium]|nr:TolC family protein [Acidobacteriota bacterium]
MLLAAVSLQAQEPRRLSLEEALALARGTSEGVAVARAGADRADANVDRTESQRKPQLSGSASYQRTLASQFDGVGGGGGSAEVPPECLGPWMPDPSLSLEDRVRLLEERLGCPPGGAFGDIDFSELGFGAPNTWNLGLSFNWPLYTGGRVEAQTRAAEALLESAETGVTSADAQAQLDVTAAYFDAQLSTELVAISEASLANSEETLRITSLRADEGAQAEFDVLQARVTRDNQRPILIRRSAARDLAFERLRALTDLPPNQPLELTTPVTPPEPQPIEPDPLDRAAVRQAASRVEAAEHQLTATRAQRRPTIAAQSQYGLVQFSDSLAPDLGSFQQNWTVGAALQIPIYTGGRIEAEVAIARADVAEAEAQLEQTIEASRLDTESALAELRAARATWEATEGTVEQATRGYELARLRYHEGISIPLEVENARLLLEQARVNRAQAARDLHVSQTRLELLPYLPLGAGATAGASMQTSMSQQAQPQQQRQQPAGSQMPGGSF